MNVALDNFIRRGYSFVRRPRGVMDLQECCWGRDFPDKRFLVIRRFAPSFAGLLSFFATTLGWIRYAIREGLIPVVDMQTWLNQHLEWWEVGRRNAWEFYFEQPCGYSLTDIRHAKNVIVANGAIAPCNVGFWDVVNSAQLTEELRGLVSKYIRIKHEALVEFYNPEFEEMFSMDGKRMIGVRARGTDYSSVRPHGSSVQPEIADFARKLSEFPRDSPIYLVSEDKDIIEPMKEMYGDRLIFAKQELPDYRGGVDANLSDKGMHEGAGGCWIPEGNLRPFKVSQFHWRLQQRNFCRISSFEWVRYIPFF